MEVAFCIFQTNSQFRRNIYLLQSLSKVCPAAWYRFSVRDNVPEYWWTLAQLEKSTSIIPAIFSFIQLGMVTPQFNGNFYEDLKTVYSVLIRFRWVP